MLWKDYLAAFPSAHGKTDFAEFMGEPISEKERTLKLINKKEWLDSVENLSDEYRDEVIKDCLKLINLGYPKEVIPDFARFDTEVAKSFISKRGIFKSMSFLPISSFLNGLIALPEEKSNPSELITFLDNLIYFPQDFTKELNEIFKNFDNNEVQKFIQNNYYSNPVALRVLLVKEDLSQESFHIISEARTSERDNGLTADIANHELADAPYLINLFKSKYGTSIDMQKTMIERLINDFSMDKPQVVEMITQAVLSDGIGRNWSVKEQYEKLVDAVDSYENEQDMSLSR